MGKKTRILVVGGSGLIGLPLCNILKLKYDVFTTYHKNKYSSENLQINIQNIESVKNVFSKVNPEIVINLCGIYNNLKFCENNKELVEAGLGKMLAVASCLFILSTLKPIANSISNVSIVPSFQAIKNPTAGPVLLNLTNTVSFGFPVASL